MHTCTHACTNNIYVKLKYKCPAVWSWLKEEVVQGGIESQCVGTAGDPTRESLLWLWKGSRLQVGGGGVCVNDQTLKFRPHSLSKRKFLKPIGMSHTNFSLDRMTALWVSMREFLDKVSWGGKTHPTCVGVHPTIPWTEVLGWAKRGTWAECTQAPLSVS